MTSGEKIGVGITIGIVVVLSFLWKHDSDVRHDGKIAALDADRARDHVVIDSLTRHSDSVSTHVAAAADTFTAHDTVWGRHRDTVAMTVTRIVTSTVADTTKIAELAQLNLTTTAKADTAIRAAEVLRDSVAQLRLAFNVERAGRAKDQKDAATEITLLKKQSRHWGLGVATGFGVVRVPDGTIRGGPTLLVGVVYRY